MYKPHVAGTISEITSFKRKKQSPTISTRFTTNNIHTCGTLEPIASIPSLIETITLASSNVDIYPKDTLTAPVGFPSNIS